MTKIQLMSSINSLKRHSLNMKQSYHPCNWGPNCESLAVGCISSPKEVMGNDCSSWFTEWKRHPVELCCFHVHLTPKLKVQDICTDGYGIMTKSQVMLEDERLASKEHPESEDQLLAFRMSKDRYSAAHCFLSRGRKNLVMSVQKRLVVLAWSSQLTQMGYGMKLPSTSYR